MGDTIVRVTIRGRVQGVGYRAWVEYLARMHNLEGWVRNRRDGSVEALFSGPAETVADMVASCRRGPSSAHVTSLADELADAEQLDLRRIGEAFSVLATT
jgi:acylphosphatase